MKSKITPKHLIILTEMTQSVGANKYIPVPTPTHTRIKNRSRTSSQTVVLSLLNKKFFMPPIDPFTAGRTFFKELSRQSKPFYLAKCAELYCTGVLLSSRVDKLADHVNRNDQESQQNANSPTCGRQALYAQNIASKGDKNELHR